MSTRQRNVPHNDSRRSQSGHQTAKRCLLVMALWPIRNSSPLTSCSSSPSPTVGGGVSRHLSLSRGRTFCRGRREALPPSSEALVVTTVIVVIVVIVSTYHSFCIQEKDDARVRVRTASSTEHSRGANRAAGIRVLVKVLGMGCLDHIHNTDQVT